METQQNQALSKPSTTTEWQPKPSLSLPQIMDSTERQISTLRKESRPETVGKVTFLISKLCSSLNIGRNMTAPQIAMCAEAIVEEMWRFKLDDIDLCFRNGMTGKYGQIYDRMDQMVIFGWLKEYEKERDMAIAKKRDSEQAGYSNVYDVFQHPQMKQILQDVTSKLDVKAKPVEHLKIRELSREEKLMQQWMSEFDDIYNSTTDDKSNPTRMIFYEGGWMDQSDYLKLKHVEYQESN